MSKFFTRFAAVALTATLILTGSVAQAKGPGGGSSSGGSVSRGTPNFQSSNSNGPKLSTTNIVNKPITTNGNTGIAGGNLLTKTGNTGIAGGNLLNQNGAFKNTLKTTIVSPNLNTTNLKTGVLNTGIVGNTGIVNNNLKNSLPINKPVTMTSNDLKSKIGDVVSKGNLNVLNHDKPTGLFKDKVCIDKCDPIKEHCHHNCWWDYGCHSTWFACSQPWWYSCCEPTTEIIVEQPIILDVTVIQPVAPQPVAGQAVVDPNAAQPVAGGAMQQALQGIADDQTPAASDSTATPTDAAPTDLVPAAE